MRPIIIDMDPGVDDALALILALHSPEVEVLGISVVSGNVPVEMGVANALGLLELMERSDIPVYSGAPRPLRRDPVYAFEVHGDRGLGEAVLPRARAGVAGGAVPFIVDAIEAHPGELTVVAIGPLTNLALVQQRYPQLLTQIRQLVIMGGAVQGPGNISAVSEFNFYADPDAARQVVLGDAPIVLVPLEATRQTGLERGDVGLKSRDKGHGLNRFCRDAVVSVMNFESATNGYDGMHLHDPLALALAVDPDLCRLQPLWLDVETRGELTAGQVVVDRRPLTSTAQLQGQSIACVTEVDSQRFMEIFRQRVLLNDH